MSVSGLIRSPREDEYAKIAELLAVCLADEGPAVGGELATPESVAQLHAGGQHPQVMEVGGQIVGFVRLNTALHAVAQLAVYPEFRGKGLGRQLMAAAESKARSLGWEHLFVGVMKMKSSLVEYYSRLGYTDTGNREEMIVLNPEYRGPPPFMIILSKQLR